METRNPDSYTKPGKALAGKPGTSADDADTGVLQNPAPVEVNIGGKGGGGLSGSPGNLNIAVAVQISGFPAALLGGKGGGGLSGESALPNQTQAAEVMEDGIGGKAGGPLSGSRRGVSIGLQVQIVLPAPAKQDEEANAAQASRPTGSPIDVKQSKRLPQASDQET
jgi:hypothetical protein